MNTTTPAKLDKFTQAYLACALWSSVDDEGDSLDDRFSISDFAPETLESAIADCNDFRALAGDKLSGLDDSQSGHDFWLTRNGHGAGFWDRGLGKLGDELSDAARSYGDCDLYAGDDGKLYFF